MVRVSKRQKLQRKALDNEEANIATNQHDEDPDSQDSNNNSPKPTTESDSAENLLIRQKLEVALNKIKHMTEDISFLLNEVDSLKKELYDIRVELNDRKLSTDIIESPPPVTINQPSTTIPVTVKSESETPPMTGPFLKYEPINRVIPRPSSKDIATTIGGKAHSLQFTVNLYVDLIEKVLGPTESSGLDYRAMVKEAILVTKAVISNLKDLHKIDSNLRWSHVDPTIKLEAYKKLEDATEHLLPLKVCSEFWGAHVLISNFWLRRKKAAAKNKQDSPQQKTEDASINDDKSKESSAILEDSIESQGDSSDKKNDQLKKSKAFSIPFLTHP